MATVLNPKFNPDLPESSANQRFIFDQPTTINPTTGQLSTGQFLYGGAVSNTNLYPSSVLSSANKIENVIPDLKDRVKKASETGNYFDEKGTERQADGTPIEKKDDS